MTSTKPGPAVPWYRVPTVWLLIAIPSSSVIAGIVMLSFSLSSYDGLVVDDYYRHGKEINRTLARDRAAVELGISAQLNLAPNDNQVRARLAVQHLGTLPETMKLQFLHPTQLGKDHAVVLMRSAGSEYFGTLPELTRARWIVQLGTPQWRLSGSLSWPAQASLLLRPHDGSS